MGVSEYRITRQLPETIKEKLPSIEEEETNAELQRYRCPYCQASLSDRAANVEMDQHTYVEIEIYGCGYSTLDGFLQHPCPSDPQFPKLADYTLTTAQQSGQWICSAMGKTPMAQ